MSRGGTRKARAEQAAQRKARERKEKVARSAKAKSRKEPRRKAGRGRAALVHLSALLSPLALALTLVLSGLTSEAEPESGFWLDGLVDDANASYLAEPAGLVYATASLVFGILLFLMVPVWLWRRLNRAIDPIDRDRSAVDTAFTMSAVLTAGWVIRIVAGFSDPISQFAFAMVLLSVYVPVFSALLALLMPVIPGSGRIGGILPTFARIPFSRRAFFSEEERMAIDRAEAEIREAAENRKAARRAGSSRKKSATPETPSEDAGESDDPQEHQD